jgi:phage-related protein (TIGR01555 family)
VVRNSKKAQAQRMRTDSLASIQSDLKSVHALSNLFGGRSITRSLYEEAYETNWIYKRVCEYMPSLATKEWGKCYIKDKSISEEQIEWVDNRLAHLKADKFFRRAGQLSNQFGGAAIVLIVDDGRPLSEPINRKVKYTVKKLILKTKYEIRPKIGQDLYEPEIYQLYANTGNVAETALANGDVHADRVLVFPASLTSHTYSRQEVYGWPSGLLLPLYESLHRYEDALCEVSSLLHKHSLLIHGVYGLNDAQQAVSGEDDFENDLQNLEIRLKANNAAADNSSILLYDKDREEIKWVQRQLGGVKDLFDVIKDDLIAATGLTPSIIFQSYSSGINGGGVNKGQENMEADLAQKFQKDRFSEQISYLVETISNERDSPIRGHKGIVEFRFASTAKPDDATDAQILAHIAEADAKNIANLVYSAEEARSRHGDGVAKLTINLMSTTAPETAEPTEIDQFGRPLSASTAQKLEPEAVTPVAEQNAETDKNDARNLEPVKKIVSILGLSLGITHFPGDERFGHTTKDAYGHIRGHIEEGDGMALDVFLGQDLDSAKIYQAKQVDRDGVSQNKIMLGYNSMGEATSAYLRNRPSYMFHGISEISLEDIHTRSLKNEPTS